MRIAIISNITWLTLHFYNFTIYFFFYNFIFDSILLQYFKLSSNLQNKKPFILHQTQKNTQYTVLRNSFTIDTRFSIHIQNIIHPFKPGLWNTSSNLSRGNYNPLVHDALRDRRSFMNIYEHGMNIDDHRGIRNRSVGISSLAESPPFEKKERKKKKRKKRKREINKYERKDPKI